MGVKEFKGNYHIPEDGDIEILEKDIERFCNDNQNKIKEIFACGFNSKENIRFSISDNGQIEKDDTNDSFSLLKDYVINFSIPGEMNPTNCSLTFFNLGSFFGANGFLYSICFFYSCFFEIGINDEEINENDEEIKRKITECLNAIDNNDINTLNDIWNTNLNEDDLKSLRKGKDFLTDTLKIPDDELKKELKDSIKSNFGGLWKDIKYNCFFQFAYWIIITFANLFKRNTYKKSEKEYLNFKNYINRKTIFKKILLSLYHPEFYENNNIFIIAMDDNQKNNDNYFGTFMGYYCPGLGEKGFARRLNHQVDDGFKIIEEFNNDDGKVYTYYNNILFNIKKFFEQNADKINTINQKINFDFDITKLENGGFNKEYNYRKIETKENGSQGYFSHSNSILTGESDVERGLLEEE